ncbi:MAG TPA: heme-binding protein [Methylocystis sp.]|nr:heme-binding protein [Methylocystis sp.]
MSRPVVALASLAAFVLAASASYAADNALGPTAKGVVQKYALTLDGAKRAAAAAEAEAVKNGWSVVIAVADEGGSLVFLQRLDGTQAASSEIAARKAQTAALFKRPTKALEEAVAGGRVSLLSLPNITPLEGGVPVLYKGQIIGAIGVSGVQSSQDAQVAKAGADALAQE